MTIPDFIDKIEALYGQGPLSVTRDDLKALLAAALEEAKAVAYDDCELIALAAAPCNHGEDCHMECDCPVDVAESIRTRKLEILKEAL